MNRTKIILAIFAVTTERTGGTIEIDVTTRPAWR